LYLASLQEAMVPATPLGSPHAPRELAEARRIQAEYEQEIIVMAECEAYFRVAYKRIIDNLPRVIDLCYLRAITKSLQPALMENFGAETGDPIARAKNYLREEQQVAIQRTALVNTQDRLDKVLRSLTEFNLKSA